jgi:hypothetical protein
VSVGMIGVDDHSSNVVKPRPMAVSVVVSASEDRNRGGRIEPTPSGRS